LFYMIMRRIYLREDAGRCSKQHRTDGLVCRRLAAVVAVAPVVVVVVAVLVAAVLVAAVLTVVVAVAAVIVIIVVLPLVVPFNEFVLGITGDRIPGVGIFIVVVVAGV